MIKIAYSDRFVLDLPESHRFPMIKYELIKEQLLYEGAIEEENLFDPGLIEEDIILLTHDLSYWNAIKQRSLTPKAYRKIGFPSSDKLVKRSMSSANGTLQAALIALKEGVAMNTAGGTHHAYADRGEGFCLLNDIAITINYLTHQKRIEKALIIDLDVHQGNGSAVIFQGNPNVFTFSMHGKDNYPIPKEISDIDIALPTGTKDDMYLSILQENISALIDDHEPDILFYQGGVDVLATDKLGKLSLTKQGCKERDEIVIENAHQRSIPLVTTVGGGYSARVADTVDAHCNTFRTVINYYS